MFLLENLHCDWNGEEIIDVYKPFSMTPKEVADFVKKITNSKKAAFSGRLDPMAHGLLRIFLNDACSLAEKINKCNKVYRFKFAFNLSTTSGDLLGFYKMHKPKKGIVLNEIVSFLKILQKNYMQQVPKYSSMPVENQKGEKHPLWWWTKNNRLSEVEIPAYSKKIYSYHIIGFGQILLSELVSIATERISLISPCHDFNQQEIIKTWRQQTNDIPLVTFEMCATVSSGFYIRQLVIDIGKHLDIPTTTIEIERLAYC